MRVYYWFFNWFFKKKKGKLFVDFWKRREKKEEDRIMGNYFSYVSQESKRWVAIHGMRIMHTSVAGTKGRIAHDGNLAIRP